MEGDTVEPQLAVTLLAQSPALIRSARRVLNNRTLRTIHYYLDYAVTSVIRIMAAQSRPTHNSMYINTLDNTANTSELSLFTTCYAPASMIWLAIAICLAVQYGWHQTNTRLSHTYVQLPTSSYMVLAQAHVCHVCACAQYSHV